jgi:hypothetical protein
MSIQPEFCHPEERRILTYHRQDSSRALRMTAYLSFQGKKVYYLPQSKFLPNTLEDTDVLNDSMTHTFLIKAKTLQKT